MDIIVCTQATAGRWESMREQIVRDLGVTQTRSTGHVFSTAYRELQVDYFRGADLLRAFHAEGFVDPPA